MPAVPSCLDGSGDAYSAICRRYRTQWERAVAVEAESAGGIVNFRAAKVNQHTLDVVDAVADLLAEGQGTVHTELA